MEKFQIENTSQAFRWVDVLDPTPKDLRTIAKEFGIHKTSIQDCLESFHLPKYEVVEGRPFLMIRMIDETAPESASNILDLTRKIAIFTGPDFLLTIHRREIKFLKDLRQKWSERLKDYAGDPKNHLLLDLLSEGFETFDGELDQQERSIEELEPAIFGLKPQRYDFRALYILKRRAAVCRRILRLSLDVVSGFSVDLEPSAQVFAQDLKDDLRNTLTYAEDMIEGLNHLMTTHHSLESQKSNEVMKVLAIFSAFFFPLTLIAGIYGMNFKTMPELDWHFGYPFAMMLMVVNSAGIYFWFKRKKWL